MQWIHNSSSMSWCFSLITVALTELLTKQPAQRKSLFCSSTLLEIEVVLFEIEVVREACWPCLVIHKIIWYTNILVSRFDVLIPHRWHYNIIHNCLNYWHVTTHTSVTCAMYTNLPPEHKSLMFSCVLKTRELDPSPSSQHIRDSPNPNPTLQLLLETRL